jgi:methylated-DNA-[protein]-cysteine S-methyltransferase
MPSTMQASLSTPIGRLVVTGDGVQLLSIAVGHDAIDADSDDALLKEARRQLAAWFDGRLQAFDLPLATGDSPRGAALRGAIAAVGYGQIASYGEVARAIGSSARAVGQACRRNPFPLIVPCHRIVQAGGAIGHYSAGEGLATKRWLLAFESRSTQLWAT